MRKNLLLLGFLLLGTLNVLAAPWGAMANYVDTKNPSKTGEAYLLRKVLDGKTLSIGLQRDEYTEKHYDKLSRMIVDIYNDWFTNAARRIERSGRQEEFADILPLLRRGIAVQISEKGSDLNVVFLTLKEIQYKCTRGAGGCYTLNEPIPHIYLPINDGLLKFLSFGADSKKRIGRHEIGHSLGFSDQYFQARSVNSDVIYGSTEERETIMEHSTRLTCDDADGIINLIDITRGVRRGGDHGWKTLCPSSKEYYVGGMSAGKGPYRITLNEDRTSVQLIRYEKGKESFIQEFPLATPEGNVVWQETASVSVTEKDSLGRPVSAVGPQGEEIYYVYLYDRIERLSVQNGVALNLVTRVHYPSKVRRGKMKNYKEMIFGQQGTVCMLKLTGLYGRGYISEYVEGINSPTVIRYLKRGFNQRGLLITDFYEGPPSSPQKSTPLRPLRKASSQSNMRVSEESLRKNMARQTEVNKREQLGKLLDCWAKESLQNFPDKKKLYFYKK